MSERLPSCGECGKLVNERQAVLHFRANGTLRSLTCKKCHHRERHELSVGQRSTANQKWGENRKARVRA